MYKMLNTKILVCAHKEDYVRSDEVYTPIHVGKSISSIDLGFIGDNSGDNISKENKSFCELTAMYWAWRNMKDIKIIGLAHYRRYLDLDRYYKWGSERCVSLADFKQMHYNNSLIEKLLNRYDIIISKPRYYNYDLYTEYCISHISDDIRTLQDVVHDLSPEYDKAFKTVMFKNEKLSHFNMFITRWDVFDDYCTWLFSILFEAKQRININNYNPVQYRIFGYMAERLLNIYIEKNRMKPLKVTTIWVNDNSNNISFLRYCLRRIRTQMLNLIRNIN